MKLKGTYDVWQNANELNAPKEILSGTVHGIQELHKEFDKFINTMEETGNVLDFACGVGRNTIELSKKFNFVSVYDFENMISMLESTDAFKQRTNIDTYTDWSQVIGLSFDAVFCSICLQHLHTEDLLFYLKSFTTMTDNLYVFTRAYNDFNKDNIFKLLMIDWDVANTYDKELQEIENASGEEHYLIKLITKKEV